MPAPKIKGSQHQDLIERLIAAGWSSTAISSYLALRYGYEVHDSTIRVYRMENEEEIKAEWPDLWMSSRLEVFKDKHLEQDEMVDVMGKLAQMIRLQEQRIVIDVKHESEMSKLFGSTRSELKVMGELLEQYHSVLQDYGLAPKAGTEVTVRMGMAEEQAAPLMLVDVLEGKQLDEMKKFGRTIAAVSKELPNGKAGGNGQVRREDDGDG